MHRLVDSISPSPYFSLTSYYLWSSIKDKSLDTQAGWLNIAFPILLLDKLLPLIEHQGQELRYAGWLTQYSLPHITPWQVITSDRASRTRVKIHRLVDSISPSPYYSLTSYYLWSSIKDNSLDMQAGWLNIPFPILLLDKLLPLIKHQG